ncbi:probable receptor-like protein kinase At1g80640 isoform X2 [Neltuma alba]|uniref:probable receptor-like protein kinase At1g80640 isoform X2 n=1 Tax=Neltuma alba TaxID=207710 RepID=UPI0010A4D283|nr:probable receptor-like protein kinase At1g80640 isoform X2 [Prosopis alba]
MLQERTSPRGCGALSPIITYSLSALHNSLCFCAHTERVRKTVRRSTAITDYEKRLSLCTTQSPFPYQFRRPPPSLTMFSSWHVEDSIKMKLLLLLLLLFPFLQGPMSVSVAAEPLLLSPTVPPPVSPASMAAFSPDIQVENERNGTDSDMKVVIALVVAGTALGAVILSFLCLCVCYEKSPSKLKRKDVQSSDAEKGLARTPFLRKFSSLKMNGEKGSVSIVFDHKTIEKATNNFLESNILGEGGFGCVYKARLHNNLDVAVKKLHCESQDAQREFQNEVDLLCKIQHPNIISLLGCSSNGDTKFIVYELMRNGSLETQLHGPYHGSALTWHMRMKIALDTARGLEYLHEICNPAVIHRDLKSSNILLDANFNAKLCDFGLAVADGSQYKNDIKLSGTLGYVAPEYILDANQIQYIVSFGRMRTLMMS